MSASKPKAVTTVRAAVAVATDAMDPNTQLPTVCRLSVVEWFDISTTKRYELVLTTMKPRSMTNVYQWRQQGSPDCINSGEWGCSVCARMLQAKDKRGHWIGEVIIPEDVVKLFPGCVLPPKGYAWVEEIEPEPA
jgi:hypothetical protein